MDELDEGCTCGNASPGRKICLGLVGMAKDCVGDIRAYLDWFMFTKATIGAGGWLPYPEPLVLLSLRGRYAGVDYFSFVYF